MIASALFSWLDKCRKYNHWIGYISNSSFEFKFSNSKQTCLICRLLMQNVFVKLKNIFVFFVFILVDAFSGSIKTEKSQKIFFTLAESNFSERKLSCTCLNFGEILFAGTKRAVPGGQYRSFLPARVVNQNTEFAAYCQLADLAMQ